MKQNFCSGPDVLHNNSPLSTGKSKKNTLEWLSENVLNLLFDWWCMKQKLCVIIDLFAVFVQRTRGHMVNWKWLFCEPMDNEPACLSSVSEFMFSYGFEESLENILLKTSRRHSYLPNHTYLFYSMWSF